MAKLIRSIIIVFSIFCFNISSYSQSLDSIKIERFKKHVSSLDYITRQVDNSKYFLTLTSQYCDSILAIDSNNLFALYFQNRVNLTLSTCDQNMNHKIELFPFFNGFPAYMGFADDPIEYAYDMALEKLLESKYIKVQNGPIANTNISSIVIRDNCDDEMFEIINQILYKNTNHYIIPYNELVSMLGHINARALTDGKLDESSVALLCDKLGLDRLGIFRANDLDVINESIWLVESEFFTYHPEVGFTEPIFTRGFNQDKRGVSFIYIFLLLIKSIFIIAIIAFLNQKLRRIYNNSQNFLKDALSLFGKKLRFVSTFFVIPLVFSFILIYSLSYLMPDPEDHYLEVSAKLWMVLITLGMSIIPTIINLYFVNRLDLDGFHTLKGYRYFANTSLYATYFPLFVFYIIQFDSYPIYPHFLLVGITLIIGDLLARSYFQYTSIIQNSALKSQAIIGVILGILSLLVFNAIILTGLSVKNLVYSVLLISPLSALHYLIGIILNRNHEKQLSRSKELNLLNEIPFVVSLLNPKIDIYKKIINTITDTELNIMLVSGPAGIGKTRSLKETKQLFIDTGWDWYYGDCDEIQGVNAISFEPFLEAFKELLRIDEFTDRGKQLEATMGKAVNIGAAIVDIDSSVISDYQRDEEQSISEMCIEIIDKLENRKNKTVFVMEDLHWVDEESYSFLKKLLKHINRNKFLRGNMCIILSMRNESLSETRGVSYSQLVDDLEMLKQNSTPEFTVEELLTTEHFKVYDFVNNLSSESNQFKIQNNSLLEINLLFNESLAEFGNQGYITPLFIFKVLEKWINDGVLRYSAEGYVLTQSIDFNSLPNSNEIDSFYHSVIDNYDEKWKRLLESAAVIGNKFNADILAQVWNYELLEVLGFLEKAVNNKLLIDISTEDNIYQFSDKRIISSIKSYFNLADLEGDKQIVLEYNKRYIQIHRELIEKPYDYSIEQILPVIRRLSTLLLIDEYLSITRNLIFEVAIRLFGTGETEQLDKLSGFNDFLRKTNKLNLECDLIAYLVEWDNPSTIGQRKEEVANILFELDCRSNSVALDFKIYALMLIDNPKYRVSDEDLSFFIDKITNEFQGTVQVNLGLVYCTYTDVSAEESIIKLHEFYNNVQVKTPSSDREIAFYELIFMQRLDSVPVEDIMKKSFSLLENSQEYKDHQLIAHILSFRLRFISSVIGNDEMAIDHFLVNIDSLKKNNKITLDWVRVVLHFMGSQCGDIYFIKYPDDAQSRFNLCENFLNKILDFNQWNKIIELWVDAKIAYYESTENHTQREQLILEYLEKLDLIFGMDSLEYYFYCIELAEVYEDMESGKQSIEYRLKAINILKKIKQNDKILKKLAINFSNISHVYRNKMSDGKNAVMYAKKAVKIKEKLKLDKSYGISLFQLARALDFNKQYSEAVDIFNQALPYFGEESNKQIFQKLVVELNLGLSLSNFDIEEAKKLLKRVVKEINKDEIKLYITKEIKLRVDLSENILDSKKKK